MEAVATMKKDYAKKDFSSDGKKENVFWGEISLTSSKKRADETVSKICIFSLLILSSLWLALKVSFWGLEILFASF